MHRRILEGIPLHNDPASHLADTNTCFLVFSRCIFKFCIANSDVFSFALNINPESRLFRAVISNLTIFDKVAAAAAKFLFLITKKDSNFSITFDFTPSYYIVRITVADTGSISSIAR